MLSQNIKTETLIKIFYIQIKILSFNNLLRFLLFHATRKMHLYGFYY